MIEHSEVAQSLTEFDAPLHQLLPALARDPDGCEFGVIGFDGDGRVTAYNRFESQAAGLSAARVMGRHLFQEVAPCMNNFMVAQRFADEPALDAQIDYVLTLRMRPTRVQLRLVQQPGEAVRYVLVRRSGR